MRDCLLPVGVPREIKPGEKRVGLTPAGAWALSKAGVPVFVEKSAALASGFKDEEYLRAGAEILSKGREVYRKADLILKVKEPLPAEYEFLSSRHFLFCFLHLASPENRKLVEVLQARKIVAIGFETVEKGGRTIFLEPMSEIAGTLAAYFSAFFVQSVQGKENKIIYPPRFQEKLERLSGQYPEAPSGLQPIKAVIFGGGVAGGKAAEMILRLGGEVDLVEKQAERRRRLLGEMKSFSSRLRVWGLEDSIESPLRAADVWIGCVHVAGKRAPCVMGRDDFRRFSEQKKKFVIDIAADQGGNFPGTHSTTYEDPLYLDSFGNFRFGVTNVPSLCGRGASEAIEKVTLPYDLVLAQKGREALGEFPELSKGVQVDRGRLVNEAVAAAHGFSWEPFKL